MNLQDIQRLRAAVLRELADIKEARDSHPAYTERRELRRREDTAGCHWDALEDARLQYEAGDIDIDEVKRIVGRIDPLYNTSEPSRSESGRYSFPGAA